MLDQLKNTLYSISVFCLVLKLYNTRYFVNDESVLVLNDQVPTLVEKSKIESFIKKTLVSDKLFVTWMFFKLGYYIETEDEPNYKSAFLGMFIF